MKELVSLAISAALDAGKEILEVYKQDFLVEIKADNSPLTLADKRAHEAIKAILSNSEFPVLSEEGKTIAFSERNLWETFWLIDPMDGTKEFIKKTGEFTVNIALVVNGQPELGVVYVPVTGVLYFGYNGHGSFVFNTNEATKEPVDEIVESAVKLPYPASTAAYTIVASLSHNNEETEFFIQGKKAKHGDVNIISCGSSIKLCMVAEGKANVYPRLAPTMEWDTAAGHAVARFAGCRVYNFHTGRELEYNKENLLNPWFVVERA